MEVACLQRDRADLRLLKDHPIDWRLVAGPAGDELALIMPAVSGGDGESSQRHPILSRLGATCPLPAAGFPVAPS